MSNFTEQHYVVQMQAPAPSRIFTPVMTTLMAVLVLCSALAYWIGEDFCRYMVIIPPLLERGWLWQLVSYASIDLCVITMLFNLWIMLFIGSALERQHKAKSILVFCLTMALLCGLLAYLVMLLFQQIPFIAGAGGVTYGLLGAFGYCFRKQRVWMFFWTIEADKAVWIIVGFGVILSIFMPLNLIFVAGAPLGWFYMRLFKGGGIRARERSYAAQDRPAGNRPGGFVDIE